MAASNSKSNVSTAAALGSCHWIDWESDFILSRMYDPTRLFSFLVCFIMFLRFLQGHEWNLEALVMGFFLNPYVILFFVTACGVTYNGLVRLNERPKTDQSSSSSSLSNIYYKFRSLPIYDQWAAEWYWWNAWLYHGVMDGAAGTLQAVPVVVSQYHILDKRFCNHHSVPWTIGLIEILIMQPLSLWTMYAILTKSSYRFPLECVITTLHMMGAVLFVFAEVYEGQLNVPALDPVGAPGNRWANIQLFNEYQLIYYWFGFWFCNFIWIWVPLYRLQRAVLECARAFQQQQQQQTQQQHKID
eukprot:CAMPEP_0198137820 /NCGR_PEP_ID=MMETSP1443-20131203/1283_1 /TAXON_ID=186043 /ORGANISM="Entomoneis sp., Strain CCMP2396" /LENGTH=300 /DNA_ID=CAMNT_0043799379 /DNA_START=100 /DNA_END=1002 /DNA_ORIENTATION=-